MARILTLVLGLFMVAVGSNARSHMVNVPYDLTQVRWSIAATTLSLDVVMTVAGALFIIGALVMHRLNTFD